MPRLFRNTRLLWAIGSGTVSVAGLIVFIVCLQTEQTRCATISGILSVAALCLTAWHGLIYIAARRGGY